MSAKPKDYIWAHFINKHGCSKVICMYCSKQQAPHSSRLKRHISQCSKAPSSLRSRAKSELPFSVQSKMKSKERIHKRILHESEETDSEDECDPPPSPSPSMADYSADVAGSSLDDLHRKTKQSTLDSHVKKMEPKSLLEMQTLFTKAIISGDVSFNFCQNEYLKQFFEKLGTAFQPPSAWTSSGKILSTLESAAKNEINHIIRTEPHFSLALDGWENIRNLGVMNVMLCNPNVTIFYGTYPTGDQPQTAENISTQLNGIIREISGVYGEEKIVAVVSDRGSNYLKARNEIANANKNIISIHCTPHLLNNLAEDITKIPSICVVITNVKKIINEIKKSKNKLGEYYAEFSRYIAEEKDNGRNIKIVSLSVPSETRWLGIKRMLGNLSRARPVLMRMAWKDPPNLTGFSTDTILDRTFWEKVEKIRPIYDHITASILATESDSSFISDVVEEFGKLRELFSTQGSMNSYLNEVLQLAELKKARSVFKARSSDTCITRLHYLTNLLDPRYRGARFRDDDSKMRNVLKGFDDFTKMIGIAPTPDETRDLGQQLWSYINKTDLFGLEIMNNSNPLEFWKNHSQLAGSKLISKVALRLFSIPASSASAERSFSQQGLIHTKQRNRLADVKLDKLMRVRWHLKHSLKTKKKIDSLLTERVPVAVETGHLDFEQPNHEEGNEVISDDEADIDEVIHLDEPFTIDEVVECD